ncbi:MAG TPA: galactokinase [Ktedonobacterales bacterium]
MADSALPPIVPIVTRAARESLQLQGELLASWAHGRVNLIGEHTDYNDGWVLPVTIARAIAFVGQLSADPDDTTIRLFSLRYRQVVELDATRLPTAAMPQDAPGWARYVAGAVAVLRERGFPIGGFSAAIDGDIPVGGGLSSSAALLIAVLGWLNQALHLELPPLELARIAQQAETLGSGVRVGILDQAASALGKPGHAILIDCRSLEYLYIPFLLPNTRFLMCDTGVERALAQSGYNERRAQCEEAVQALAAAMQSEGDTRPIRALRDVTWHDFLRLAGHIPEPARRRARHVVRENQRTLDAVETLRAGDAHAFGDLVLQSHASLRDDYAVSCPELDAVVEIATAIPGALGARMVGAGFGGGALIVAQADAVPAIQDALHAHYPIRTGKQPAIFEVIPDGGPGTALVDGVNQAH